MDDLHLITSAGDKLITELNYLSPFLSSFKFCLYVTYQQ